MVNKNEQGKRVTSYRRRGFESHPSNSIFNSVSAVKIRKILSLLATVIILSSCVSVRLYDGDPDERSKIVYYDTYLWVKIAVNDAGRKTKPYEAWTLTVQDYHPFGPSVNNCANQIRSHAKSPVQK